MYKLLLILSTVAIVVPKMVWYGEVWLFQWMTWDIWEDEKSCWSSWSTGGNKEGGSMDVPEEWNFKRF